MLNYKNLAFKYNLCQPIPPIPNSFTCWVKKYQKCYGTFLYPLLPKNLNGLKIIYPPQQNKIKS